MSAECHEERKSCLKLSNVLYIKSYMTAGAMFPLLPKLF